MAKYRVKYGKRIIGYYQTRNEAVSKCEEHAHKQIPAVVNFSQLKNTTVVYLIELIVDGNVVTREPYTAIIAMRK